MPADVLAESTRAPDARERIALVLGAGGARGLAQIGVIEVLEERGFRIDAISGSSSGALVGGIHAAGRLRAFDERIQRMSRRDFLRLLDPGWRRSGVLRGARLVDAMREVVGDPLIETLPVEFTAVAVDLQRQREVWIRRGRLWDALRASFAIPGLFTPHRINGRALVDGGLLAPLPIAATRLSDAHRLVAVDMHGWPQRPPGEPAQSRDADGEDDAPDSLVTRFGDWIERKAAGDDAGDDGDALRMGVPEIMSRSLDTMQAQIARVQLAMDPPELLIRIPRDVCQFYEFWRAAELIEVGRAEATKALDRAGY